MDYVTSDKNRLELYSSNINRRWYIYLVIFDLLLQYIYFYFVDKYM